LPFPPQLLQFDIWLNASRSRKEDALVALAGRPVKWTGLAVQQQRFEPDSNAD
jgi:hypothetical protein